MDLLLGLLPLIIVIAIYWAGYKAFKKKHGEEGPSPNGVTPYGIHGWLGFFIFASYYITPLYSFGQLTNSLTKQELQYPALLNLPGYQTYKNISYLLLLVFVLLI
jgi:hypothetical protein